MASLVPLFMLSYMAAHLFIPDKNPMEKVAVALGLGIGLISQIFLYGLIFHIHLSPKSFLIIELLLFFLFLVCHKRNKINLRGLILVSNKGQGTDYSLVLAFLLPLTAISFFIAYYFPITEGDGIRLDNVSNAIFYYQDLSDPSAAIKLYPLQIPLWHGYQKLLGITRIKCVLPFIYFSLVTAWFFRMAEANKERKYVLLSTCIVATTPLLLWHSHLFLMNLITGYYYVLGVLYWFAYMKNRNDGELILSGIFLGLAACCRFEFILYSLIPIGVTAFYGNEDRKQTEADLKKLILPFLACYLWWPFLNIAFPGYYNDFINEISVFLLLPFCFLFFQKIFNSSFIRLHKLKYVFFLSLLTIFCLLWYRISIHHLLNKIETSTARTLVGFYFFLGTSAVCLIILNARRKSHDSKYLGLLLLLYLAFHTIICGIGESKWQSAAEYFRISLFRSGDFINASSVREMIAFFPIYVFYFLSFSGDSHVVSKDFVDNPSTWQLYNPLSGCKQLEKITVPFLVLILLVNVVVATKFFVLPRVWFLADHRGLSHRNIQLTDGSPDNTNIYKKTYQLAYWIYDNTPANSSIYMGMNFDNQNGNLTDMVHTGPLTQVLFPRRVIFGDLKGSMARYIGVQNIFWFGADDENTSVCSRREKLFFREKKWVLCEIVIGNEKVYGNL